MLVLICKVVASVVTTMALTLFIKLARHRIKQLPLRRIRAPEGGTFTFGHFKQMYGVDSFPVFDQALQNFGRVMRVKGFFGDTQLVISDPRALNSILIKDSSTFAQAETFVETHGTVFGPGLLGTLGDRHKRQRKMLNPVFSTKHMRHLMPVFHQLTKQLRANIMSEVQAGPRNVDMLDHLGAVALELIGQGGLGHVFGSLEGKEGALAKAIKEYVPTLSSLWLGRQFFPAVSMYFPHKLLKVVGEVLPWENLHRLMKVTSTIHTHAEAIFRSKMGSLARGDDAIVKQMDEGKDILSILVRENMEASSEDRLPDEEIVAQIGTFLFAGTDTTSSGLSRILYLLSTHQDAQDKLREELIEARASGGDLSYDELMALPYLEAICRETLRFARADAVVPLSTPIQDVNGQEMRELFIPNNTNVVINIVGVNRDPDIWGPDATEWKPERWLAPLPESVAGARIPGVYANTGFKLSELEMKMVLLQLVSTFRFTPSKREVYWRFGSLITPSVRGSSSMAPELPMMVSLA
ncbi:cytochrome P450 [Gloeopeniophorella convolvens]|nr:cytochrome P450 [Gloeopeniophorella convolvens]